MYVDFRILCPILPQSLSNFGGAPRFTPVLEAQSTVCGDIAEATGSAVVPTNDGSQEQLSKAERAADLGCWSPKNDRMRRYDTMPEVRVRSRAHLRVPLDLGYRADCVLIDSLGNRTPTSAVLALSVHTLPAPRWG